MESFFELLGIGAFVGVLSGFFGIGGGTILVPLLLLLGYETKKAIGISIVLMVFASIYGSYLNSKKGTLDVKMVSMIGMGGFLGAFSSGYVASYLPSRFLEIVFFLFVSFALARLFTSSHAQNLQEKQVSGVVLFLIGTVIGFFSMLIGVGGSVVLVPLLVGFLHIELKKATSAGLFFVVFSSVSGLVSHALNGHIDYETGFVVGVASLAGVYLGIHIKHILSNAVSKRILLFFYLSVLIYLAKRIFF